MDQQYSTTPTEAKNPLSINNNSSSANFARAGMISVLSGGADPTGGSVLWDGLDFLKRGSSHPKFGGYNYLSINGDMLRGFISRAEQGCISVNPNWSQNSIFNSGNSWWWSSEGNSKSNFNLHAIGSIGVTIFWGITKK